MSDERLGLMGDGDRGLEHDDRWAWGEEEEGRLRKWVVRELELIRVT